MVARRSRPGHVIGPQSALTDFLAANNISANQIRQEADQRRQAAEQQNRQTGAPDANADSSGEVTSASAYAATEGEDEVEAGPSNVRSTRGRPGPSRPNETPEEEAKRREKESKAIEKIKAGKAFKKRARDVDDDDEDTLDAIARAMMTPLPGQMDNCEICSKRFTVTAYSRSGPTGGLLCPQCSKEAGKNDAPKKKRKSTGGVGRRRAIQSNIMDGTYHLGAKNLMQLCIEKLAQNVHLAEDLGELPPQALDKIARLFSKRRLLRPKTLPLFVQPTTEVVNIYSAAYLSTDDLISVFQTCSRLKQIRICDGIQFKDEVMDYLLTRHIQLEKFSLHGANLLTSDRWIKFLQEKGAHLQTLQSYCTDQHFNDNVVAQIGPNCPNMRRLKIDGNGELTSDGAKSIGSIKSLQHLSLRLIQEPTAKALIHIVREVGQDLQTLSFKEASNATDELLSTIKSNCSSLRKLRVTLSENLTDEGFVDLFTDWKVEALDFVDFEGCRQLDAQHPRENPENVGLCSGGFVALMNHSGTNLRHLNVASCRHISKQAFEEVFSEEQTYAHLARIDVSFCEDVDDFVVGCIMRSCPALRQLKVFGCMKVTSGISVARSVNLIGVPNAMGVELVGQ